MQRTDVIKEMKEFYSMVPVEKKKLLKDFFLNINLKNIAKNSFRNNNMEDIFKNCSLTNTLYDWENLNEYILCYLQASPTKNMLIMQSILSYNPN